MSDYPKTWHEVALERGMPHRDDECYTGQDYWNVGVSVINGCPNCGATVAPYNSYKINAKNDYAYCADCAGVEHDV